MYFSVIFIVTKYSIDKNRARLSVKVRQTVVFTHIQWAAILLGRHLLVFDFILKAIIKTQKIEI